MTFDPDAPRTRFGGHTRPEDTRRLCAQGLRIFNLMGDSKWRTLEEIREITGDPEASVSARLRDMRKPEFGGHEVFRRARGPKENGLYEYKLSVHIARYEPPKAQNQAIPEQVLELFGQKKPATEPAGFWVQDFLRKCEQEKGRAA